MGSEDLDKVLTALNFLVERNLEDYYREEIRRLNKQSSYISWGRDLHILMISDRGSGRIVGLCEYLHEKTDFTSVKIVNSLKEAHKHIQLIIPDIVIFVGMQDHKENYKIIEEIKEKNINIFPAMYAANDCYVERECEKYGICCIGDCCLPTDLFINTMKAGYSINLKIENKCVKGESEKKDSFLKRIFENMGFI